MSAVHKWVQKLNVSNALCNLRQHVRNDYMKMVAARSNKGQKEMEDKKVHPLSGSDGISSLPAFMVHMPRAHNISPYLIV